MRWFGNTLVSFPVARDGLSVIESLAPHGDSPPLHVHHTEDEVFHLVSGRLTLKVGDEELELAAGETALGPKGVPHTYRVDSEQARWLVVTTGGDFEAFVQAASRPAEHPGLPAPAGPPTPEAQRELGELAGRFAIELVGPPLA
jgi:mannose-6-phosphate isomerase-like protein (cupin superfamily)